MHKQYIVEWGSVSSDVIKASANLAKTIWKKSFDQARYYSMDKDKPYVEGEFEYDFKTVGFDIDVPFIISYTIYITDNIDMYNSLFADVNGDESANSSTDFENHRINIVSGMIGGHPSPDFIANVMHEVDHVFEYMKGYKKNDALYNRVVNGINSGNEYIKSVATLMYYCFKHEQDAFVHEFYGALVQNQYNGNFDNALYNFSEYANLFRIKMFVTHDLNRENVKRACVELGTSFEHVLRFSNYISKKMKNKLFNAYKRYCVTAKKTTFEEIRQRNSVKQILFNEYRERYKDLIIKEEKYIDRT